MEQLNQEIAEIENSTKRNGHNAHHPLDMQLDGNNVGGGNEDATMESQSFTIPSQTADWFDMDTIAEIER